MGQDNGAPLSGRDGHEQSQQAVSAVPVAIPSAENGAAADMEGITLKPAENSQKHAAAGSEGNHPAPNLSDASIPAKQGE